MAILDGGIDVTRTASLRDARPDAATGPFDSGEERGAWEEHERTVTPTRITVAGASPRWWAFEDAATDFGKLDVAPVTSWTAAAQIISDPNWDQRWWNKEEQERNALKHELTRDIPEQVLLSAVTEVTNAASRIAHGCAAIAAGRDRLADEAMPRAAAGAATQACYFKALAIAAGKPAEHPFHLKYGLFAAGRWPLGIADGRFHIF